MLFKLFHNVFHNIPQIVLWHTRKEIKQRFEVNTKSSTRMRIFHRPKLDDIVQKNFATTSRDEDAGCGDWKASWELMYGKSFTSSGSEVSIPAITRQPKTLILACKMMSESQFMT